MKFGDWLDVTEVVGLYFVVYTKEDGDEEPLWTGKYMDIPHWIAKCKLATDLPDGALAIDYRGSLGEEYGNKPGFVVIVED